MPSNERLTGAECADLCVLFARWVNKEIFSLVISKLENYSASEIREQRILLQLVSHDWHITESLSADSHSLLRVSDGVVQSDLASRD